MPLGQPEKAIGEKSQIEPWLALHNRSACPATAKRREMVLPSSPSNRTRLCEFPFSVDSSCCRNDAVQFLTQTSRAVLQSQPWFYLRLFAYRFFWLSEGA